VYIGSLNNRVKFRTKIPMHCCNINKSRRGRFFFGSPGRCPMGRGTFGVSSQPKSIVKHRILGVGKRVSCAKTGWIDLNDLYVV